MNALRTQLVKQIETVSETDLKAALLSWIETYQRERAIKALQQSFADIDNWEAIENLVGSVEAPSDWAAEHDHYLYNTPKHSQ